MFEANLFYVVFRELNNTNKQRMCKAERPKLSRVSPIMTSTLVDYRGKPYDTYVTLCGTCDMKRIVYHMTYYDSDTCSCGHERDYNGCA